MSLKEQYEKEIPVYDYVFYHYPCTDGFASAFLYWKVLGNERTQYIGLQHAGKEGKYEYDFANMQKDCKVLFVDIVPADNILLLVSHIASVLHVVDHHKTAIARLDNIRPALCNNCEYDEFLSLDNSQSGATLTFTLLAQNLFEINRSYPQRYYELLTLALHVADRDLWTWQDPETAPYSEALMSYPFDFEVWNALRLDELVNEGNILLRAKETHMSMILANTRRIMVGSHRTALVNSPVFCSELANNLLENMPDIELAIAWTQDHEGYYRCSLRSRADFDCSTIAKFFNGGGHAQAAGCTISKLEDLHFYGRTKTYR